MDLWGYQVRAVDWLLRRKRGIVVAPAGSGKTIIAAAALDAVISAKPRNGKVVRVGWVCHTIEQKQQALDALARFPNLDSAIRARVECAAAYVDWSDCDVLIVDECHHSPSASWSNQIATCSGARWGFTATPKHEDPLREAALHGMFANEMLEITREEVGLKLVPATVHMLQASDAGVGGLIDAKIERDFEHQKRWWRGTDWELRAIVSWNACIKLGIVENRARNQMAVDLASRHAADHVLMLVNQIEHGQELSARIAGSQLCYSQMGSKNRREAIAAFRAGEIRCLLGTSMLDEGADLPIANVLITVSGGRSDRLTQQRSGRVLRIFAGKPQARIYDFLDLQHRTMHNHAKQRMKMYRLLGYQVCLPGQTPALV